MTIKRIVVAASLWFAFNQTFAQEVVYYEMEITGVKPHGLVNLRAQPSIDAPVVIQIPFGAKGIKFGGQCRGFRGEVIAPSRDTPKAYWCQIVFKGHEGWLAEQYMTEAKK